MNIDRPPLEHDLKVWPSQFAGLMDGTKRHEVRKFDRDYRVGDTLHLREWLPGSERYTGRSLRYEVSWITQPGEFGLPENVGVVSLWGPLNAEEHP